MEKDGNLVLTRIPGQGIIITCSNGDKIKIRILATRGKQTRFLITAPKSILVHREEIQKLIDMDSNNIKENDDGHFIQKDY